MLGSRGIEKGGDFEGGLGKVGGFRSSFFLFGREIV